MSSIGYAYVVARVNNALIGSKLFDLFDMVVNTFHNINLAYHALSDDVFPNPNPGVCTPRLAALPRPQHFPLLEQPPTTTSHHTTSTLLITTT